VDNQRILVDVPALAGELARGPASAVLDVRWTMAGPDRAGYAAGHLPGAAFLDLDAALAGPPGAGGRHPLPDPGPLQDALRRAGVRAGQPVVVYDGGAQLGVAARAWWVLRWAGLADVRVLDGGYPAWVAAGEPVETGESEPGPGDVEVHPGFMRVLDAAGAAALAADGALVDARQAERFRGEKEPIDPVAGHIPGAVNQPVSETVDTDGRLLPADELRTRFEALGLPEQVGAYCGSGIMAAQTVLALTVAGYDPALYVSSWSHWITDRNRQVATGD